MAVLYYIGNEREKSANVQYRCVFITDISCNWENMWETQIMGVTLPYKPSFPMCISLEFG